MLEAPGSTSGRESFSWWS